MLFIEFLGKFTRSPSSDGLLEGNRTSRKEIEEKLKGPQIECEKDDEVVTGKTRIEIHPSMMELVPRWGRIEPEHMEHAASVFRSLVKVLGKYGLDRDMVLPYPKEMDAVGFLLNKTEGDRIRWHLVKVFAGGLLAVKEIENQRALRLLVGQIPSFPPTHELTRDEAEKLPDLP